jgi:hypothetical protein
MFRPKEDELAVIRAFGNSVSVSLIKTEGPKLFGRRPFKRLFLLINTVYDYLFFRKASKHDARLKVSLSKSVVDRIVKDSEDSTRLRKVGEITKG